jgi:hypothetical protein
MVAFKAHFDGKVFVPDEPVNLEPNQRVTVQPETTKQEEKAAKHFDFRQWIGIADGPEDPNARFKTEDDVWEDK